VGEGVLNTRVLVAWNIFGDLGGFVFYGFACVGCLSLILLSARCFGYTLCAHRLSLTDYFLWDYDSRHLLVYYVVISTFLDTSLGNDFR
jgi:hypothetical protein